MVVACALGLPRMDIYVAYARMLLLRTYAYILAYFLSNTYFWGQFWTNKLFAQIFSKNFPFELIVVYLERQTHFLSIPLFFSIKMDTYHWHRLFLGQTLRICEPMGQRWHGRRWRWRLRGHKMRIDVKNDEKRNDAIILSSIAALWFSD